MKNLFLTIKNNPLFGYLKRLAILCVFLSISVAATAFGGHSKHYSKATVTADPTGGGTVYVATNSTKPASSEKSATQDCGENSKKDTHSYYFWADPNEGYTFINFTDGSKTYTNNVAQSISVKSSSTNSNDPTPLNVVANFRKIIDPKETNIEWTKKSDEDTYGPIGVTLANAKNFAYSIRYNEGVNTTSFRCTPSSTTVETGDITLTFSAGEDVSNGMEFVVVLEADNGGYAEIKVKIISSINVTFAAPSRGGSFVAKPTNMDGETYNSANSSRETINLSDSKAFPHTLTATADSEYDFMRWVITDANGNPVDFDSSTPDIAEPITDNPYNYSLKDGDIISAEFVKANDYAQFQVEGNKEKSYFILEEAIKAAQPSGTIVVSQDGILYTGHKTMTNGKYEFTIPSGITLLVPGEDTHKTATILEKKHTQNVEPGEKVYPYRRLNFSSNTRIVANGNICVYADVSYKFGFNGTPLNPGVICMGANSEIIMNSGSNLTAFGYIYGDPSSQVIVNDGAKVCELFQFRDWRGGTRMMTVFYGDKRVFLFSQYYVQNIECRLILNYGAIAYASSSGSEVNLVLTATQPILTIEMISKATTSSEDKGIFCIGENTRLVRWYDSENDKQKYEIEGINPNSKGSAKFGVVYTEMSGVGTVDSRNFVLPITNNMDITLRNVDVVSDFEYALLPGSHMIIDGNSSLTTNSSIFVYDKEYLRDPADGLGFCYYGGYNVPFKPVHYTATKSKTEIEAIRTESKIEDAKVVVNGIWTVNDGNVNVDRKTLNSGLYTTGSSSSNEAYGANITSQGGGKIVFNVVNEVSETYQFQQGASTDIIGGDEWPAIPVTNARLRNGDNTCSAGENAKRGESYTYSQSKEKWVLPQEIAFANYSGHEFTVRMLEPATITQNLVVSMTTADELSLENFEITLPNNSYFTKGEAQYNTVKKQLIIPITYTVTGIHNLGNPNSQKLTIKCKDANLGTELDSDDITLTAIEDYTPDFTIKIGDKDVTTDKQYTFVETEALSSSSVNVVITPDINTVATSSDMEWSCRVDNVEGSIFTTEGTTPNSLVVVYTPQTAINHTGTLIVTAIYTDNEGNKIPKEMSITLNGIGRLQDSKLDFEQELKDGYSIYQGLSYENIFADLGNGNNVTFTYTYVGGDVDGQDASELVAISLSESKDDYTIKIAEVESITETRTVKVVASQTATDVMNSGSCAVLLTVLPPAIWNWSDLYFGQQYTNPVTPSRDGEWSLTKKEDVNDKVKLQGDYSNYSAEVASGGVYDIYEAKFLFVQGEYKKEFVSKIYADPRILGFCVDAPHKYKGVTQLAKGGVSFDDATDVVSLNAGAEWVIQMLGMPDRMSFITNGNNQWNIEQSASESSSWSSVVRWTDLGNGEQSFSLLPTTRFVRITYGSNDKASIGKLSNVCISKLSVKADVDEVYLPIHKDGSVSSTTIVLTHTEKDTPTLSPINGLTYETSTSDNFGTEEEPYYETTLTIKTPSSFAKDTYEFTATQGSDNATIRLHADYLPQGLPIDFASDDEKRYHFVATESSFVSWDATKKQVVLQNPGGSVARSVVLAFEGAPSRISFTASRDIVDSEWKIYESEDGSKFVESSIEQNRDKESGANFVHNLKYTTRYVRIYYYSENQTELRLSNLLIEGDPMLLVNPDELEFSNEEKTKTLTLTAINLENIKVELDNTTDFKMSHGSEKVASYYKLTPEDYPEALGVNKVGNIEINTEWITNSIVNDGIITIYNMGDIDNTDDDYVLAKVKLVGAGKYLKLENAEKTGLYTGIPDGTRDINGDGVIDTEYQYTYHGSSYSDYTYHEVDLRNAFSADGTALFDYLFVYGETTPSEGDNITAPAGDKGSNARTPCYVYIRDMDVNGNFDRYRFVTMLDNVNVGDKAVISDSDLDIIKSSNEGSVGVNGETLSSVDVKYIEVSNELPNGLSVYITGFAPYATTGYTKADEGVFLFRGKSGAKLHVYLEDAHIFARNKMKDGQPFYTRGDERNPTFSEKYARGSGGVLVFECVDQSENIITTPPFEVTIHTIGRNLLKSNYGCFNFFFGMDPFQISAPIHVHLRSADHERTSKTVLNFTDEWPTKLGADRVIETFKRTNGFLSLQKQSNNAPSIDLGNPHTVVNFLGGQVELQNAQIVSTNYKTTLAISYRSGEYGSDNLGLKFASGIGTDAVDGTVNFYDGTVTILPMWVKEEYKNYYLIDKDADGNEIKRDTGRKDEYGQSIYEYQTTCLRTPKNTNVYGGSICWLRACQHVTSKGGAPSDGTGRLLGQYVYEFGGDDTKDSETGLVTRIKFPACVEGLENYYNTFHSKGTYGIESVMPDKGNKLYFWIPEGYGGVTPEKDNILTTWKACMTEISAEFYGQKGSVGGNTSIEANEEVKYLLYCKIDDKIHDVIKAQPDGKTYSYEAPVEVPAVAIPVIQKPYTEIRPSFVGGKVEHEVLSDISYTVTDKVYYVTTATADIWKTFTAPFDVAKIWVVEAYSEEELEALAKQIEEDNKTNDYVNPREAVLEAQAKHNADFAAFFGVAMAIGTTNSFEEIYSSYLKWAKIEDGEENNNAYTKRGKYELTPYINLTAGGTNWNSANFYINENDGNWGLTDDPEIFDVNWKTLNESDLSDGILMHKGETYSLLFPYCVGCWDYDDESNNLIERTEWDYWSGKFLIFESPNEPQTIDGRNFLNDDDLPETNDIFNNKPNEGVMVTGNSTFSFLETNRSDVYSYVGEPNDEYFASNYDQQDLIILPTESFLYGQVPTNANGASVLSISRTGKINYRPTSEGNGNDTTDTHVPTINGDCDIFVTATAEGIRVAVEEPQYVGVFAANGALIFNGWVDNAVDVALVNRSVYVVVGENNSVKVIY